MNSPIRHSCSNKMRFYNVFSLSALILCSFFGSCLAINQTLNINLDGIVTYVSKFGFLASGTAQISVLVNVPLLQLAIIGCSDDELNILTDNYDSLSSVCVDLSKIFCTIKFEANFTSSSATTFKQTINETAVLYFYLLDCYGIVGEAVVHLLFVNPGGEQLSSEYIPLPLIFIILCGVWVLFTFLWCVNWIYHRSHGVLLHRVITAFPVSKIIWTGFAIYYWKGLSIQGWQPTIVIVIYYGVFIVSRAIFYGVLLVIARGWGITRDHLGRYKWFVLVTMIAVAICFGLGIVLSGYFLLISFVVYIMLLVLVFRSVNVNLRELSVQLANPDHDPSCDSRYRLYRLFKIIMLAYVTLILCVVMLDILFLQDLMWITILLEESLDVGLFVCIGLKFRLRRINIYYKLPNAQGNIQLTAQQEREVAQQFVDSSGKGVNIEMNNFDSTIDAALVVGAPQNANNVVNRSKTSPTSS